MKTFKGICLKDSIISDGKVTLSLIRGNEYIISLPDSNDTVTVFSNYWASGVPLNLFGELVPGPGESHSIVEIK